MKSPSFLLPVVMEEDAALMEISPLDAQLFFRTPPLVCMTPSGISELPSLKELMESPSLSLPVVMAEDAELVEISPLDAQLLFGTPSLMLMTPIG